jgi:hemerythrin-like domain-containing protein
MTTTTAIARPDTHDMIVVHRVFRRESDLMPTLIRAVPDGDTARAEVLAQAFSDYQLGLHLHHTGEDELVWPLLLARVDLEADMVLRMETQHEVVAGTLAEASRRMPDWQAAPSAATAAPLVSALTEHRAALLEHLHDEEEHILPLIEEHLTVAEWARLGQRFAEEVPKDKMLFFLGMILEDADPAERQAMMANLPAPARFAWKAFGQRQFRRRVSKIRAVLPGQVPLDRAAGRARPGPAAPALAAK